MSFCKTVRRSLLRQRFITEGSRAFGRPVDGHELTGLAHAGDERARSVVAAMGRALGAGISGLVNAFDPDVVVVGGGVIALGELLLAPAREEAAARLAAPVHGVPIVAARFGEEAGLLGAAVLAVERLAARAATA